MLIKIKALLSPTEVQTLQQLLMQGQFIDGKLSAGQEAKAVKANLELDQTSTLYNQLNQLLMPTLVKHPEFQRAVLPLKVASPYYVRYTQGMHYGNHVDNPIMGPLGQQYRSDVSTSIFLNDAADYQGGELIINTCYGEETLKLDAGDVVIYPSSSVHRVSEVTQGQRLAAVIWSQSLVADAYQRELLYNLSTIRDQCQSKTQSQQQPNVNTAAINLSDEINGMSQIYANLVRMWSQL